MSRVEIGRFTGRKFLAILVGAFVLVSAVNGLMIWFALSSWTGLVSDSAYAEGLGSDRVLAQSRAEAALGWRGSIEYDSATGRLTVALADRRGRPLAGLHLTAQWLRPTSEGFDREIELREATPGRYEGSIRPSLTRPMGRARERERPWGRALPCGEARAGGVVSSVAIAPVCCATGAAALDIAVRPPADGAAADPAAFVRQDAEGVCRLDLMAENIHCADCIRKIEGRLLAMPGVTAARVNLGGKRIAVAWREGEVEPLAIAEAVTRLGYPVAPFDPTLLDEKTKAADRELLCCLGVAGFAAGNVMLLSVSVWSGSGIDMDPATRDLFHWISALIALPAVAYAGRPFFRSAWGALKGRVMNMDVPISLGVVLASGMSLIETMHGAPHAYFDAAVSLLFFLLCGRYLDRQARARARSAAEHLLALTAVGAVLIEPDGRRHAISVVQLRPGMTVAAAAGDRIPTDGIVASGRSTLDNSLLTGESMPAAAGPGDKVYAGALNLSAPLEVRVTAAGEDTLLAGIARLMSAAEQGRAHYVRLADRVARLYAPLVHVLAASPSSVGCCSPTSACAAR
jgi:nitrogen fixation protein FixH/copper chaperone CopZ